MTAPTAQFDEIATTATEQVNAAVRTWADAVTSAADSLTAERPALIDPKVLVEKYFDYAQLVLDKQREFAKSVLAAGSETAKNVTEQTAAAAKSVTAQTVEAVEKATEQAVEATEQATAQVADVAEKATPAKPAAPRRTRAAAKR